MFGRRHLLSIVMMVVMIANRSSPVNDQSVPWVSGFCQTALCYCLSTQIHCADLLAGMAEFAADDESCLEILLALIGAKNGSGRSTRGRTGPAGQLFKTCLGVGMAQAMQLRQSRLCGMALVGSQLLDVVFLGRNQDPFRPISAHDPGRLVGPDGGSARRVLPPLVQAAFSRI